MKLILVNESKKHIASKDLQVLVKRITQFFLQKKIRNKKLLREKKEITLVFLSASEMRAINNEFRHKDKPTDILSFGSEDPNSLGELLLCLPVLQKQAREQKHSLKHEMSYMIAHGILHLLGYDHELSKAEEKIMFRLQDECFAEIV